jgi:maltose/moltooligosaccharide transporter
MNTPHIAPTTDKTRTPLSLPGILWYSLANIGYGMFYAFNNFIIPLWLQGYTQDARLLGIMGGSHSFEGVIIQPIVGSISDRLQGPGGRRRPFMRIFILLSALFLLLAPAAGHLPPPVRLAGVIACIFLFTLTFNVAMDPYQALLADITTPEQRGRVTGFWFFVGALGQVTILLLPIDKSIKFFVVGLLMLATTWLTCFKTKEPLVTTPPETSRGHIDDIKLALAGLRTLRQTRTYILMFMLYGAGIGGVVPFLSLFIQHILSHPGMTPLQLKQIETLAERLPALLLILTALGSITFGWLTDKIGPKRLLMFSLILIVVAAVNGLWVQTPLQIAFVLGVAGLGVGAQNASAYPLLTRIVPAKEIGFYVGLQTAAASLAGPGAVWLTGALINHSGYRVIFGVCAVFLLLAFAALSLLREQEANGEIAARLAEINV